MWEPISLGSWHGSRKRGNLVELSNLIALQRFPIPKEVCLAGLLHSNKIRNPTQAECHKTDYTRLSRSSARKQNLEVDSSDLNTTRVHVNPISDPAELKSHWSKNVAKKTFQAWEGDILLTTSSFICLSLNTHPHSAASCLSMSFSAHWSSMLNRREKEINLCKQEKVF